MIKTLLFLVTVFVCITGFVWADTFGTGDNQFTIDFVTISGDASSANGTNIGGNKSGGFLNPGHDYRIGKFEITNDQWNKFQAEYGTVNGSPVGAYDESSYYTGNNLPTNEVSWYEAAQFVNYLNTSTGHQVAYKFTGTQGTSSYTFAPWDVGLYRNSNAFYFLPTDDEWVKAAYWNGTTLQTYATIGDTQPVIGVDTNYYFEDEPWAVGSGVQELNGTYDMMGNVWEWMESPYFSGDYLFDSNRTLRGGSHSDYFIDYITSTSRNSVTPSYDYGNVGFRVASIIPEPCTLLLLGVGGLLIRKR